MLWATCAAGLSPAAAATQEPSGVQCAGVQLAPAPLGKNPDLNPDGTPVRISPDRRGKYVPIIMVHGWTGSSTHTDDRKGYFSGLIDRSTNQLSTIRPSRSLIGQLQRVPGVAVFTFDYHNYSARWVDDTHIGPALGTAIDCLYRAFGEKVIVVAHSMGGLAARFALTHPGEHGEDRSGEVSNVITFGTPETGSLIASLAAGALDAFANSSKVFDLLRLLLAECGKQATISLATGTACDLLPEKARAADSQAGRALRTGSPELAALQPFPASVPVHALYGDNFFTVSGQGWFRAPWDVSGVSVGDLLVMPDSATAGATSARKASCSYELNLMRVGTDAIEVLAGFAARNDVGRSIFSLAWPCYHSNLMRTVELTNEATGLVNEDITGRTPLDDVIRFDGIGIFDLTMTAADLRARGFTDHGNLYTETDPDCVSYTKPGATLSFSVERKTGRILGIKTGSGRAMTTQVGKIHAGSTLAELKTAFRGYRIEERFDMDFGQGSNGVIVNGGGGAIGFSLDGVSAADFASERAKVTYLNGVGLPGHAPSNMETGC
ncbi:alpha/beta hydrolase [Amycolatopsis sp. H6(2020)]|nr:alpha/beta hydrolase [Amycolatopsis sp. H6(2020)]